MDDSQLSQFIPKLEDRIALTTFWRRQAESHPNHKNSQRISLLHKLRDKFSQRKLNNEQERNDLAIASTSKKSTRIVEIGLMIRDKISKPYRQIRLKPGRGTQKQQFSKSMCKAEILKKAEGLFFPNGTSRKFGHLSTYESELIDFEEALKENETIGDIFEVAKITHLRLYLALSTKEVTHNDPASKRDAINSLAAMPKSNDLTPNQDSCHSLPTFENSEASTSTQHNFNELFIQYWKNKDTNQDTSQTRFVPYSLKKILGKFLNFFRSLLTPMEHVKIKLCKIKSIQNICPS